jgi:curved DNA-binding protein CbpA
MVDEPDFQIGQQGSKSDESFIDFYELMQISRNAEAETIDRVYRMLAARLHPDNTETGDKELFMLLQRAREILLDPETRAHYDQLLEAQSQKPLSVFSLREFAKGIDGEANRRMGVLCLLYNRRRVDLEAPGLSVLELESMMSCPREHLMFALWYLKEKQFVRQDDQSSFVITGTGVDYVEEHIPKNQVLYKLLKAAESGATAKSTGRDDPSPEAEADGTDEL